MTRSYLWLLVLSLGVTAARAPDAGVTQSDETPQSPATITYSKVFPGSSPEYVWIEVREDGAGQYEVRRMAEEARPRVFRLPMHLTRRIFDLSSRLQNFRGVSLDWHRKIANLGKKSFRYQRGEENYETSFNYTSNPTAAQLAEIFEALTRQQLDLKQIQHAMKHDRLGLVDALRQFEVDLRNQRIADAAPFVPLLLEIGADASYVDIARKRARALASLLQLDYNASKP